MENPLKPLHILIHERFHQFEFDRFQPPELIGNYQDHLNAENLALSKLEEQVLFDFMQAQGDPVLQRVNTRSNRRKWNETIVVKQSFYGMGRSSTSYGRISRLCWIQDDRRLAPHIGY